MTNTNFLGIPVEGDISGNDPRTPQRPLVEFEPLMRAVLDDPTIKAFGWRQYTPYFNDGDPCEFGVHGAWFVTVDDDVDLDEVDDDEYGVDYGDHPSLGCREYSYSGRYPDRVRIPGAYTGPDEARYDRVRALSDAIVGGEFDDVLLEAFGDHAAVRVSRESITVDTYEHD